MAYITLRIDFSDEVEDFNGEKQVFHKPLSVSLHETDMSNSEIEDIAETAFQSDVYMVGVTNAFMSALGGGSHEVKNC